MARRPRPVDPTPGPIQAFAPDLRELREKAGSPPSRALPRRAGYSAATLSEAARGQRRPSLDVTLAYVGACGGDLNEWRLRWHDLNTQTRDEPPPPADPEPPEHPHPVVLRRERRTTHDHPADRQPTRKRAEPAGRRRRCADRRVHRVAY